jgi:hypothetical protein
MSAYELACSITAPIAWTNRASTRTPSEGANAQAAEPATKMPKP